MVNKELSVDEQLLSASRPTILDDFAMTHPEFRERLDALEGPVSARHEWGVALYFLVNKSQEEIQSELEDLRMKEKRTDELFQFLGRDGFKDLIYRKVEADEEGYMVFPPKTVVLGHTDQEIKVPRRTHYRMHDRFIDRETGLELPLLTNVTAPGIQTKNKGPQTYEIYNVTDVPLRINVRNLICVVDEIPMSTRAQNGTGTPTYGKQDMGVIRLGDPYAKFTTAK